MTLTFYPDVASPVLHPLSHPGPAAIIPAGTTYVSLTQAAYLAAAAAGIAGDVTYAQVTQATYEAVPSPAGATVITHDDKVTLTIPGICNVTTHSRPVVLTVPPGS